MVKQTSQLNKIFNIRGVNEQHNLYILMCTKSVIYIGRSGCIKRRLAQHKSNLKLNEHRIQIRYGAEIKGIKTFRVDPDYLGQCEGTLSVLYETLGFTVANSERKKIIYDYCLSLLIESDVIQPSILDYILPTLQADKRLMKTLDYNTLGEEIKKQLDDLPYSEYYKRFPQTRKYLKGQSNLSKLFDIALLVSEGNN